MKDDLHAVRWCVYKVAGPEFGQNGVIGGSHVVRADRWEVVVDSVSGIDDALQFDDVGADEKTLL